MSIFLRLCKPLCLKNTPAGYYITRVLPLMIQEETNSDELLLHAVESAKKAGYIHTGDMVVITAGLPLGISGTTNLMKVDKVD